ncbi:MAG: hypothetical protein IPF99_20915 [Deltaproteobacteria bacterium]|nr:hypothetical protein [Deltaproteobacteria bacterium]
MFTILFARDLSLLLERQMTAASTRAYGPAIDRRHRGPHSAQDLPARSPRADALEPYEALRDLCGPLGITVSARTTPT